MPLFDDSDIDSELSKNHPLRGKSMITVLFQLVKEGGFWSLYNGIGPQLAQAMVSTALLMMVKERVNGAVRASLGAARAVLVSGH